MSEKSYFAIGSYTQVLPHAPKACGQGVSIISLDHNSGDTELISQCYIENPSYLYWDNYNNYLYSLGEVVKGNSSIYSLKISENKKTTIW